MPHFYYVSMRIFFVQVSFLWDGTWPLSVTFVQTNAFRSTAGRFWHLSDQIALSWELRETPPQITFFFTASSLFLEMQRSCKITLSTGDVYGQDFNLIGDNISSSVSKGVTCCLLWGGSLACPNLCCLRQCPEAFQVVARSSNHYKFSDSEKSVRDWSPRVLPALSDLMIHSSTRNSLSAQCFGNIILLVATQPPTHSCLFQGQKDIT